MDKDEALDLPAILKQAEAAMSGPWLSATRASPEPHIVSVAALRADDMGEPVCELRPGKEATGEFIAAARTNVPLLVAALAEAQEKLAAFREAATLGPNVPASEILAILGESA